MSNGTALRAADPQAPRTLLTFLVVAGLADKGTSPAADSPVTAQFPGARLVAPEEATSPADGGWSGVKPMSHRENALRAAGKDDDGHRMELWVQYLGWLNDLVEERTLKGYDNPLEVSANLVRGHYSHLPKDDKYIVIGYYQTAVTFLILRTIGH